MKKPALLLIIGCMLIALALSCQTPYPDTAFGVQLESPSGNRPLVAGETSIVTTGRFSLLVEVDLSVGLDQIQDLIQVSSGGSVTRVHDDGSGKTRIEISLHCSDPVTITLLPGWPIASGVRLAEPISYQFQQESSIFKLSGGGTLFIDTISAGLHPQVGNFQGEYWYADSGFVLRIDFSQQVDRTAVEDRLRSTFGESAVKSISWLDPGQLLASIHPQPGWNILSFFDISGDTQTPILDRVLLLDTADTRHPVSWESGRLPMRHRPLHLPQGAQSAGPQAVHDGRFLLIAGVFAPFEAVYRTLWVWDSRSGMQPRFLLGQWNIHSAIWLTSTTILVRTPRSVFIIDDQGNHVTPLLDDSAVVGVAVTADTVVVAAGTPTPQFSWDIDIYLYDLSGNLLRYLPGVAVHYGYELPEVSPSINGDLITITVVDRDRTEIYPVINSITGATLMMETPVTPPCLLPAAADLSVSDVVYGPSSLSGMTAGTYVTASGDRLLFVWIPELELAIPLGPGIILGWDRERLIWLESTD